MFLCRSLLVVCCFQSCTNPSIPGTLSVDFLHVSSLSIGNPLPRSSTWRLRTFRRKSCVQPPSRSRTSNPGNWSTHRAIVKSWSGISVSSVSVQPQSQRGTPGSRREAVWYVCRDHYESSSDGIQVTALPNGGPSGVIYELYVDQTSSPVIALTTSASPYRCVTGWSRHLSRN